MKEIIIIAIVFLFGFNLISKADEGRNSGVRTVTQTLQVKVGWASVVMLFSGSFLLVYD